MKVVKVIVVKVVVVELVVIEGDEGIGGGVVCEGCIGDCGRVGGN